MVCINLSSVRLCWAIAFFTVADLLPAPAFFYEILRVDLLRASTEAYNPDWSVSNIYIVSLPWASPGLSYVIYYVVMADSLACVRASPVRLVTSLFSFPCDEAFFSFLLPCNSRCAFFHIDYSWFLTVLSNWPRSCLVAALKTLSAPPVPRISSSRRFLSPSKP